MVDYTNELRRLREMQDELLLRYGTSRSNEPSSQEIRAARAIKDEIGNVWNLAILTNCKESEEELITIQESLERLANLRGYNL
jgi:hypothetical protein